MNKPLSTSSNGIKINSITPISGPSAGGNTLAIAGTNLSNISNVTIGSQNCIGINKTSNTLTCTIPSNVAGTYSVAFRDSIKSLISNASFSYTYVDPLTFTKIEPATGFSLGGNLVTITGSAFDMNTNVLIGGQPCWGIFIIDSTKLNCNISGHPPGAVNVQITNINGNSITTSNSPFSYLAAPKITTISPTFGPQSGNTVLTITGTDFLPGLRVYLDSAECINSTLNSNHDTINCTTSSYSRSGNVIVSVVNPDSQVDAKANAYYYLSPPTITTISPNIATDGSLITISTSNYFYNVKSVKIDGVNCTGISSTIKMIKTLTCTVHSGSKIGVQVPVTIINGDDQIANLSTGFTFITAPSNLSLSINHGSTNGNYPITVYGIGFRSGAKVSIGNSPCNEISNNISTNLSVQSSITCTVPQSNIDGQAIVTVTNFPDGLFAQTDLSKFTYNFPPKINAISPVKGADNGGEDITIVGEHFSTTSVPVVNFGITPCSIISNTSTTIHCSSPRELGAGMVSVAVINPDSQSSSSLIFTYVSSPTITNVSPASGSTKGSTLVTVSGTSFTKNSYILFGNTPCTGTSFSIAGQITTLSCLAPAHSPAETVTLSVVNPDGGKSAGRSFIYRDPPITASVKPSGGSINGGTQIEIDGTGFLFDGSLSIKIGQADCQQISPTPNNNITCYVPVGNYSSIANTPQNIIVTNSDSQSGSLGGAYIFENAPTVTSISPNFGPTRGGGVTSITPIVITGNNFIGSTVTIGGSICSIVSLNSGEIQCIVGSHFSSGTFDVVITNSDTQFATSTGAYTYYADPTIYSVTPSFGISSGANPEVTIKGTDFRANAQVKFGPDSCTSVTVDNIGQIRCTPPVRVAGSVSITVTNTDDYQSITSSPLYTYRNGPTITSVSPKGGPKAGGAIITITGTNFIADVNTKVKIGGVDCPISSVSSITATTITCKTAGINNNLGSFDVQVINADGQVVTNSLGYTYQDPPTFTTVTPTHGIMGGAEPITVYGTNFINPKVYINGIECVLFGVPTATSYPCKTPSSIISGSVILSIVNEDLQSDNTGKFNYYNKPVFSSISPSNGYSTRDNPQVTITGSNFRVGSVTQVQFGNINCAAVLVVSDTKITCMPPLHSAGTVPITITNDDGQYDSSGSFIYRDAPIITNVTSAPTESLANSGPATGGNTLKIFGSGFYNNSAVIKIAGIFTCGSVTYNSSDSSLSCIVPTGTYAAGASTLVVTNDDTQVSNTFTYTFVAGPQITKVSNSSNQSLGAVTMGTPVKITGTNFNNPTSITFGGKQCTNITLSTSTEIDCTTPTVSSGGPVDVEITNIDGQSSKLINGFIYLDPPSISSLSVSSGPIASASSGPIVGGNTITIVGTNFFSGATVKFGNNFSTTVTFVDSQHLNCVVPSHVGAGVEKITVTNPDTQTSNYINYSYSEAPTVVALDKTGGSVFGQTPVQVFGNYFVQGATVTIGGVPCTSTVVSNISSGGMAISCVTGAHSVSATPETTIVTNPDNQNGILASSYLYRQAPNITSIAVTGGQYYNTKKYSSTLGGETILIQGTNFDTSKTVNGPFVSFGGTNCPVITTAATQITCTLPAHSAGVVDVKLTNSDGQTVTSPSAYTFYGPLALTKISPQIGSVSTSNIIFTVNGSNFINDPSLKITLVKGTGAWDCPSSTYIDAGTVTCTWTNFISEGVYDIRVSYFGDLAVSGTLYSPQNYSSQADPSVSSITPAYGNINGGTQVTIAMNSYIYGHETVTIGGSACNVDPSTGYDKINRKITCTTTSHLAESQVIVVVANPDTSKASTEQVKFDYIGQPTISGIFINSTITTHIKGVGNETIVIKGTNFYSSTTTNPKVSIGGLLASCGSFNSTVQPNTITCLTPAHAEGTAVEVKVINPDNQFGTSSIDYWAAPQVDSVDISSGTTAGGTKVTISGKYFHYLSNVSTVNFDNFPCVINSFNSTSIICTTSTSNGSVISSHIQVKNGDTQLSNSNIIFNYINTPVLAWGTVTVSGMVPLFQKLDSFSFGTITTNVTQTLSLANIGDKNSTIGPISLSTDSNSSGLWLIGNDTCSNQTLYATGGFSNCSVQITFLGAAAPSGDYTATLSVTDSNNGIFNTFNLTVKRP